MRHGSGGTELDDVDDELDELDVGGAVVEVVDEVVVVGGPDEITITTVVPGV